MSRISKNEWIKRGLKVLSEEGYYAIRIDWLCEKFKITKGSFYHHFDTLEDYERQLLKHWEQETRNGLAKVLEPLDSPQARLNRMIEWVFSLSGTLELSLRAWALHNKQVKKLLANTELRRIGMVTDMYVEIGVPRRKAREIAELGHAAWIGIQTCHMEGVVDLKKSVSLLNEVMKVLVKDQLPRNRK